MRSVHGIGLIFAIKNIQYANIEYSIFVILRKAVSRICLICSNFMFQISILPDFTVNYANSE